MKLFLGMIAVMGMAALAPVASAAFAETRTEFAERMKTSIDEADREIGELKQDLAKSKKSAQAGMQKKLQQLEAKRADLQADYKKFEKASDKAWDRLKLGMEKALKEVKSAYSDAKEEYKK
jgi:septal ring factor EnvC (AmiA/AmiB activator)